MSSDGDAGDLDRDDRLGQWRIHTKELCAELNLFDQTL